KFTEPDPAHVDQNTNQTIPWPFFRYTELVLNYVEAVLEADGDEAEAKAWLDQIRFRVGLPAVTETGADLMEVYRNERRLELTFEEHRYHDTRRWMIAPATLGDRKSTRLNSSHVKNSYAVFCLKKKKITKKNRYNRCT